MVLLRGESLEKVYFDFLSIIIFILCLDKKKNINQSRVVTCRRDPQIVQKFTKKESLFKNFKDWILSFWWNLPII